jgi:uncharacterized protein
LLRIFIGESNRWRGKPLYEAIVKARELHTPARPSFAVQWGFGAHSRLHTTKILRLSGGDLPMIVEIVDAKEKIEELMPHVGEMVKEGLVTLERVQVIKSV